MKAVLNIKLRDGLAVVLFAASMLVSVGCSSPTAPHSASLNYSGSWVGTHQIATCRGAYDMRGCAFLLGRVGTLELTLRQSNDTVAGNLSIQAPSPFALNTIGLTSPLIIEVTGNVSKSGELHLDGSMTFNRAENPKSDCGEASVQLADWSTLRIGNEIIGRMTLLSSGFSYFCFPQTIEVTSALRDVSRQE